MRRDFFSYALVLFLVLSFLTIIFLGQTNNIVRSFIAFLFFCIAFLSIKAFLDAGERLNHFPIAIMYFFIIVTTLVVVVGVMVVFDEYQIKESTYKSIMAAVGLISFMFLLFKEVESSYYKKDSFSYGLLVLAYRLLACGVMLAEAYAEQKRLQTGTFHPEVKIIGIDDPPKTEKRYKEIEKDRSWYSRILMPEKEKYLKLWSAIEIEINLGDGKIEIKRLTELMTRYAQVLNLKKRVLDVIIFNFWLSYKPKLQKPDFVIFDFVDYEIKEIQFEKIKNLISENYEIENMKIENPKNEKSENQNFEI